METRRDSYAVSGTKGKKSEEDSIFGERKKRRY